MTIYHGPDQIQLGGESVPVWWEYTHSPSSIGTEHQ